MVVQKAEGVSYVEKLKGGSIMWGHGRLTQKSYQPKLSGSLDRKQMREESRNENGATNTRRSANELKRGL